MAHNILRKIDIDQFSSKKIIAESVPSEGDIIGPDDEKSPIACMKVLFVFWLVNQS